MRSKSAILLLNISKQDANIEAAIDEDCQLKLVANEKEALEFIKLEYSSKYVLFGLISDPTKIHKELYNKRLKGLKK